MTRTASSIALAVACLLQASGGAAAPRESDLERGRYLVSIGGCNDCHTAGYAPSNGEVPEQAWLTGDTIGFQGPWGTTYPTNLRLLASQLSEAQWLARARAPMRPPMPAPALRAMTESDLLAIYHYTRSLGAQGVPAPAYVLPGGTPKTPVIVMTPVAPAAPPTPVASSAVP